MKVINALVGTSICLSALLAASTSARAEDKTEVKATIGGGVVTSSKSGSGPQGSASLEFRSDPKADRQGSAVIGGSVGVIGKTIVGRAEIVGGAPIHGAGNEGKDGQIRVGGTVVDATPQYMRLTLPIVPGARIMNNDSRSSTDISIPFLNLFQDRKNQVMGLAPGISVSTNQYITRHLSVKGGADIHLVQGVDGKVSNKDEDSNNIFGLGGSRKVTQNGTGTFFSLHAGLVFHAGQNGQIALEARYDDYRAKGDVRDDKGNTVGGTSLDSHALTGMATAAMAF